ncbi:HNH endonuclease [bacterium]|nr:HNH endonuclease [bacterium]
MFIDDKKEFSMTSFEALRQQGIRLCDDLRRNEKAIIALLVPIEKTKGYLDLGYSSLYAFCIGDFKLSDYQACNFIAIARKSESVPELKLAVEQDQITLTNAGKIAPLLTQENKELWLPKAAELPKAKLEMEIKKAFPEKAVRETIRPVAENRLEIKFGASAEFQRKLARTKEILSNQLRKSASHEEAFEILMDFFLKAKDPVQRAERAFAKKALLPCPGRVNSQKRTSLEAGASDKNSQEDLRELFNLQRSRFGRFPGSLSPGRRSDSPAKASKSPYPGRVTPSRIIPRTIPRKILHEVNQRDRGACQHKNCGQKHWTEVHHIKPWGLGGGHSLENLTTLCSAHHASVHRVLKS